MSALSERLEADASKFVDPTLFGEPATYWQASTLISSDNNEVLVTNPDGVPLQIDNAPSTTINVLFFEAYEFRDVLGIGQANVGPAAIARAIDVPQATRNDVFQIEGVFYFVLRAQDDGSGLVLLALSQNVQ